MSADRFRKLAALGLTTEQIAGVLDVMDAEDEARREKGRKRWREWKDRQDANVSQHLQTSANGSRGGDARVEDNLLTKNSTGQKKTKDSFGASAPERDFFAEFWLAYPRREGPNPKKPAKLVFDRLVAKGKSPEAIIAAAKALAKEHPTPTRFIPQAQTWLNQERFADEEPVMSGDEFCAEDWPATRILVTRFRNERQHDPPRAVNGGKAGYLLPAEWVAISRERTAAHG